LRADGYVLPGGHRQGSRDQSRQGSHEDRSSSGLGRGHTDDETARGDQAVVGPEHRRTEPTDVLGAMEFEVSHRKRNGKLNSASCGHLIRVRPFNAADPMGTGRIGDGTV
jgi:hypothetical protein